MEVVVRNGMPLKKLLDLVIIKLISQIKLGSHGFPAKIGMMLSLTPTQWA